MGRPSDFTEELATKICKALAEGQSLREICEPDEMPNRSTVFLWLSSNKAFSDQYALARAEQAEFMADEIVAIADDGTNDYVKRQAENGKEFIGVDHENIQRSKLRVDARKWVASKLLPKKYGDFQRNEISGPGGGPIELALAEKLQDARNRAKDGG